MCWLHFPSSVWALPLYRGTHRVAPLSPGAVVVPDRLVAEQVLEDEPGVAAALPDTAVGHHLVAFREACLALVDLPQLVRALERAVLAYRPRPRYVGRRGYVTTPQGTLLRVV